MMHPPNSPASGRAFTLIELVVVLLILAILAGIAAPRYADALARFRVEAAAKRIAVDLRYTRQQAIQRAASGAIEFYPLTDSYSMDVTHPSRGRVGYDVNLANEGFAVDIVSADFASAESMGFDHRGDASASGSVVLSSGGYTRTVTVTSPHKIEISP